MSKDKIIFTPSETKTKCLLLPTIDGSYDDRASAFLIRLNDNLINRIKTSKILFGMGLGRIEGLNSLHIKLSQKDFKEGTVQILKPNIDGMDEIHKKEFTKDGYCFIEEVSIEQTEGYHLGISNITIVINSNGIYFKCSNDDEIYSNEIEDKYNLFYEA